VSFGDSGDVNLRLAAWSQYCVCESIDDVSAKCVGMLPDTDVIMLQSGLYDPEHNAQRFNHNV